MAGALQYQKLCPSCGASMAGDANICSTCGHNFNKGVAGQPPGYDPYRNPSNPQYPNSMSGYPRPVAPVGGKEGLAIASLVLGVVGIAMFCSWYVGLPCAVLAIVFGIMGKNSSQRGLALAGIIMGIVGITIDLIIVLFFLGFMYSAGTGPR